MSDDLTKLTIAKLVEEAYSAGWFEAKGIPLAHDPGADIQGFDVDHLVHEARRRDALPKWEPLPVGTRETARDSVDTVEVEEDGGVTLDDYDYGSTIHLPKGWAVCRLIAPSPRP